MPTASGKDIKEQRKNGNAHREVISERSAGPTGVLDPDQWTQVVRRAGKAKSRDGAAGHGGRTNTGRPSGGVRPSPKQPSSEWGRGAGSARVPFAAALPPATPFSQHVQKPVLQTVLRRRNSNTKPPPSQHHLWGKLKSCSSRRELAMLENNLQFQAPKDWNMLLTAHARAGNLQRALKMPCEMRSAGVKPDVTTYTRLIKACEQQWETALSVLEQMPGAGVKPNVITYSAAISACEKGGQWEKALWLLDQMQDPGMKPDMITYSATISACEKGGQWEKALWLLDQMQGAGMKPNVITYNAAIQACAFAGQSVRALQVFDEAQSKVETELTTYNAILDAVCTSHPAKARELYISGRSLYRPVERTENGIPLLDLHNHSEGAGETAVRWWFEERVLAMTSEPEQLIIVTGWGKSRSAIQDSDLRGRVERLLAELLVPTLPVDNQGRFILDAQTWLRPGTQGDM